MQVFWGLVSGGIGLLGDSFTWGLVPWGLVPGDWSPGDWPPGDTLRNPASVAMAPHPSYVIQYKIVYSLLDYTLVYYTITYRIRLSHSISDYIILP